MGGRYNARVPSFASDRQQVLIEKIRALPTERILEVEDFVDFLWQRDNDRRLVQAAARISEEVFAGIWDNPDDADYDRL